MKHTQAISKNSAKIKDEVQKRYQAEFQRYRKQIEKTKKASERGKLE